ncbi:acetylornithine transaminase [Sciscionella marina]|uniref:acetylornithine transaminase n=1 Tax=Sciscionella marina TaxID=508770 RepID=UPI0004769EA4|nr:acetylornithine transaminase [Sciscionella marina]
MESAMSNLDNQARWRAVMMDNYGTPELTISRGEGATLYDADGAAYTDLLSGIAVNALGHAHPAIVAAVSEQIAAFGHTSNFYAHEPGLRLAERLLDLVGAQGKALFCNSGAEATEAALKITRLTGRGKIVACEGAFHGRTMGALSITGQPGKRAPFEPLVPGVQHVPYGDVAALEAAVDAETAAVFLEPVLGEAGVLPAPDGYLHAAREITRRAGALLVIDEVQTGIGRTGSWFAFQQAGILPDLITLAKGLGGGLPFGAVLGIGAAGELFTPGTHGTTFGGNPVCAAAGLAVLDTIAAEGLCEHAEVLGKHLASGIEALGHDRVRGVRGLGLLLGIGLTGPIAKQVSGAAQRAGYLVNAVAPDTIRLAPPLVLSEEQANTFVSELPSIVDAAGEES